jgi:uncharacterized protein with PIN domain
MKKCKDCNINLKTKKHTRGCDYIFNNWNYQENTKTIFWYCPKCGLVFYFK